MLNIYDGSVGALITKSKLVTPIEKYLISNKEPLNYEVNEGKTSVVIITGKNQEEKNLPTFNHPLIFKRIDGQQCIAVDLRLYARQRLEEDFPNVTDILVDRYNGLLAINRLIFNRMFLDGETDFLSSIQINVSTFFGLLISRMIRTTYYDITILNPVTLISMLFFNTLDSEKDPLKIDEVITTLSRKDVSKLINGDMKVWYKYFTDSYSAFKFPANTIGGLVSNLKLSSPEDRLKGLSADIFLGWLSRSFNVKNMTEISIGMIEHKPTFLAIVYHALSESFAKNTLISKVMIDEKYNTKPKEILKVLDDVLKDQKQIF